MANTKPNEWATIRIPLSLVNEVQNFLNSSKYKKMGFTSVSSFVSYLIRKEIDSKK